MRKILVSLPILLTLASCTLPWDTSFDALYDNHVHEMVSSVDHFSKALGLSPEEHSEGSVSSFLTVPGLFSGALSTHFDIKTFQRSADFLLSDTKVSYDTFMASGALSAKTLRLISHFGDTYLRYDGVDLGAMMPSDTKKIIDEYAMMWLAYTQTDALDSLSGASQADRVGAKIAENLSKMTLKDVEKYLTQYHIWKNTADLGTVGTIHTWSIDMDRDRFVALAETLTTDITETRMSDNDKKNLRGILDGFVFSGTLAFDTSESRSSTLSLAVSLSGGTRLGTLSIATTPQKTDIFIHTDEANADFAFRFSSTDTRKELQIQASQSGTEVARVVASASFDGRKFQRFDLSATAEGVSVSLEYIKKDDTHFEGRMTLPVGTINWNGTNKGKKLTGLSLKGTIPDGSLDLTLTEKDTKLTGPLMMTMGGQEIFRADIALVSDDGKFSLDVEVPPAGTGSLEGPHFFIESLYKVSDWTQVIDAPKDTVPMTEMMQKLDAMTPKDEFMPEVYSESIEE